MSQDKLKFWLADDRYAVGGETITSGDLQSIINGNAPLSSVTDTAAPNGMSLTLANPATAMANKIKAFFAGTPGITVSYIYKPFKSQLSPELFDFNSKGDQMGHYMKGIITKEAYEAMTDFDGDFAPLVVIYVTDPIGEVESRAEMLNRTIKHEYDFGGIKLYVVVFYASAASPVPFNPASFSIRVPISAQIEKALEGNPNFYRYFGIYVELFDTTYHFLEFMPNPVFVQLDNFSNYKGYDTYLPVDLFKEIFDSTYKDGDEERSTLMGFLMSTYVPENKMK